jgi:hypothetical protein
VRPLRFEGGPSPEKASLNLRRAVVLRVFAYLASWLPFIVGPASFISHGWRPVGDEAAIALRSWSALTSHGPLVGQATRLAHGVFDPGPLEYWLLTIPVHVDPAHGVLWGAALFCLVACSLTIEAAWAAGGEFAGLSASGLIVGLVLWIPGVALTVSWNPWFGMMFFLASLAAGWAVLAGHRRWWPVCVITASVAAQAHLMFTLGSAALVLLALIVGIADSIRARAGYWWVLIGLLAGAGCWSAPAIQQFTMPRGNIAALLHSTGRDGPRTGAAFALKALSATIQPPPIWWMSPSSSAAILQQVTGRSLGFAVAALILLAVAGIAAIWPLRCRWLAALAAVTLLLSLAALVTYSSIPVHSTSLRTLTYLLVLLFPVGVLSWLVIGSAAVLAVGPARSRVRAMVATRLGGVAADGGPARWARRWTADVAAAMVAVGVAVLCALVIGQQLPIAHKATSNSVMQATVAAARQIERVLPSQRIAMTVRDYDDPHARERLTLGISWALTPPGYYPKIISSRPTREIGPAYVYRGGRMPLVTVVVRRHIVRIDVAKHVPTRLLPQPTTAATMD